MRGSDGSEPLPAAARPLPPPTAAPDTAWFMCLTEPTGSTSSAHLDFARSAIVSARLNAPSLAPHVVFLQNFGQGHVLPTVPLVAALRAELQASREREQIAANVLAGQAARIRQLEFLLSRREHMHKYIMAY